MPNQAINLQFNFKLISKDNEKIMNKQGRYFLSAKYKAFEKRIATDAKLQYQGKPLEGDVSISILVFFNSKVHSDATNLFKGCCDALSGICYLDDRQIKDASILLIESKRIKDCFNIEIKEICPDAIIAIKRLKKV